MEFMKRVFSSIAIVAVVMMAESIIVSNIFDAGIAQGAIGDITANCDNLTNTGLYGVSIDVLALAESASSGTYRAYYMGNGIASSKSSDGVVWTQESGQRITPPSGISSVSNPWVFITKDNRYRMIYEAHSTNSNTTSDAVFYSAISTDGVNFTNEGPVMAGIQEDKMSSTGFYFLSVPIGVRLSDGSLRMYYVSDGSDIRSAVSTNDGLAWTRDGGTRISNGVDPMVFQISPYRYVMFYTDWAQQTRATQTLSAYSTDGLNFTLQSQPVVKVSSPNVVYDPFTIMADGNRMRLYFSEGPGNQQGLTAISVYTCVLPLLYSADNCTSTLSSDMKLHVPIIKYSGINYWADFAQQQTQDGTLAFTLTTSYGTISDTTIYSSCQSSTLDSSLNLSLPVAYYGNTSYRATFLNVPGSFTFKLNTADINK